MSGSSDAQVTRSPSRYMASDYHRLTNPRTSSPPSPDLESAHEPSTVQANDRRPAQGSPDKRASPEYPYIAPCVVQGLHDKNQIRRAPRACVKEDDSCKISILETSHRLLLSRHNQGLIIEYENRYSTVIP